MVPRSIILSLFQPTYSLTHFLTHPPIRWIYDVDWINIILSWHCVISDCIALYLLYYEQNMGSFSIQWHPLYNTLYWTEYPYHRGTTTQDFDGVMSGWVFATPLYIDKRVPVAHRPTKPGPRRHLQCRLVRNECWKKSNILINRRRLWRHFTFVSETT